MEPLGPRRLSAIPDEDIKKTVVEDVVIHCNDETYDIVIATPAGYDYRVTCPNFKTISKDRDYVIRWPFKLIASYATDLLTGFQTRSRFKSPARRKHEDHDDDLLGLPVSVGYVKPNLNYKLPRVFCRRI
ncbi:hypothetical protein V491_03315 [Pseudogymnoascus sp. VKM F-3775]|nr:hypothetical protein V491_03315 [Pseudogymnoascus sp. VKM F-3775]